MFTLPVVRAPERTGQDQAGIAGVVRFHHHLAGGAGVVAALRVGEVEEEIVAVEWEVVPVWYGYGGRVPGHGDVAGGLGHGPQPALSSWLYTRISWLITNNRPWPAV